MRRTEWPVGTSPSHRDAFNATFRFGVANDRYENRRFPPSTLRMLIGSCRIWAADRSQLTLVGTRHFGARFGAR